MQCQLLLIAQNFYLLTLKCCYKQVRLLHFCSSPITFVSVFLLTIIGGNVIISEVAIYDVN